MHAAQTPHAGCAPALIGIVVSTLTHSKQNIETFSQRVLCVNVSFTTLIMTSKNFYYYCYYYYYFKPRPACIHFQRHTKQLGEHKTFGGVIFSVSCILTTNIIRCPFFTTSSPAASSCHNFIISSKHFNAMLLKI